jgi:hypothetical protein
VQTNAILQRVLQVMNENHPAHFAIHGDSHEDVSPTRAAIELGLTRGYSKYSDTLRLLSEPITMQHTNIGETTYEKETQESKT